MTSARHTDLLLAAVKKGEFYGQAPLAPGELIVPAEVVGNGEYVVWRWGSGQGTERASVRPDGMLDALVKLRTPQGVQRFVKRYGPLFLCPAHGLPVGHNLAPVDNMLFDDMLWWHLSGGWPPSEIEDRERYCMVERMDHGIYRESVPAYLKLARAVNTALILFDKLSNDAKKNDPLSDIGTADEWKAATMGKLDSPPFADGDTAAQRVYRARGELITALHWMTTWARLRPSVQWLKDQKPAFLVEPDRFGVLLLQLMHSITTTQGVSICDGCSNPYAPKRKPQPLRRHFCDACRADRKPGRLRKREQREREAEEKGHE